MRHGTLLLLVAGLAGCQVNAPVPVTYDGPPTRAFQRAYALVRVTYDGPATRAFERSGSLHMSTGGVESDYVPYTVPQFIVRQRVFSLDDQRVFAESLKSELNRLKLLRVANISWYDVEPADVTVEIVFQRTFVFLATVRYHLDVVMHLRYAKGSLSRRYLVSSEGESAWTLATVANRKELAAKNLMARLIPDIEAFLAGVEK